MGCAAGGMFLFGSLPPAAARCTLLLTGARGCTGDTQRGTQPAQRGRSMAWRSQSGSSSGMAVICVASPPVAGMTHKPQAPLRLLKKAMRWPSGLSVLQQVLRRVEPSALRLGLQLRLLQLRLLRRQGVVLARLSEPALLWVAAVRAHTR